MYIVVLYIFSTPFTNLSPVRVLQHADQLPARNNFVHSYRHVIDLYYCLKTRRSPAAERTTKFINLCRLCNS